MFISDDQLKHIETVTEACRKLPWWSSTKSFRENVSPDVVMRLLQEIAYWKDMTKAFQERGCAGTVPDTFMACGESKEAFCSEQCLEQAKIMDDLGGGDAEIKEGEF
jgi:hypothetical protein